ncbi:MAG: tetratricopeptide repeat protein [Saprospiraceae bacterium]
MKKNKDRSKNLVIDKSLSVSQENRTLMNYYFLDYVGIIIIILVGIVIYSNSFSGSFHFDDKSSIVDNPLIRNLNDFNLIWKNNPMRFVSYYSFALNYHFGKLDPWGYHLVNLCIHLINSLLVYWFVILVISTPALNGNSIQKDKKLIAFFAAILFVSHPLATQSVSYIVQRMASLSALFYILSVSLFLKGRLWNKEYWKQILIYTAGLLAACLAFFTKENSYTLPFALILVEVLFIRKCLIPTELKSKRKMIILFAIGFLFLILILQFGTGIFKTLPPDSHNDFRAISAMNYLSTQFSVLIKYIQLLILPINLNLDYDYKLASGFFEWRTIASFILLSAILVIAMTLYKNYRIISFGILWFFLSISIESSFKPISDLIFEHRTYLPSVGYFLVLSAALYYLFWNKSRAVVFSILILIITINSYLSYERNKVWKDEQSLWTDVIAKSPNKARGYFNLALVSTMNNDTKKALEYYNSVIRLQPLHEEAYNNRSLLLSTDNRKADALADCNKMIELFPNSSTAYNARASYYITEKNFSDALQDVNKSIQLKPMWEAYNNRGLIFLESKKFDIAIEDFNKSIQLNANNSFAYYSLGIVYESLSNPVLAYKSYTKALEFNPAYIEALFRLGNLYSAEGKFTEAINKYNEVNKINPNFVDAYNNRGNVFVSQNKYSEALVEFNKAIELNPLEADSYNNRGTVFMGEKKYSEAIFDFNKAIELNSNFAIAFANRGICLLNSGKRTQGCLDLQKAVNLGFQSAAEILSKNCR